MTCLPFGLLGPLETLGPLGPLGILGPLGPLGLLGPLGPLGGWGAVFLMTPQRFWTLHRSCKSPTYSSLEKQLALCVPNASTASNARIKRIMHTTWTSST